MTNVPFTAAVRLISDGDPTNADITNQPAVDLTQRTDYLKQQLDGLEAGQLLRVLGATLESGLSVGTPVYLDNTDNVFKKAKIGLAETQVGGAASKASYVFGCVLTKETDTSGSIAVSGRISSLTSTQWAAVMADAVFVAGHYFLSGLTAGKITLDPGALAVYVGQALPDGTFLLRAAPPVFGAHTHYEFDLVGKPAGTVIDPAVGDPQVVNTPDATQRGWLPASAPYFDPSWIPVGAFFGYNIAHASETELAAAFPPIPVEGVTFAQSGLLLDSDKVVVNEFGIWWMDDTYGNAPWPIDYAATLLADPVSFWFSRLLFATAGGIVNSLENHANSVLDIQIVNGSGAAAIDGRLRLLVTDVLPNAGDTDEGVLALKEVTSGEHTRGPVASRLIPGAGIVMTSLNGDSVAGFYGKITVSASNSAALQGSAELVNLNNAREDVVSDLAMVTMPAGRDCTPVFQLEISKLAPTTNKVRLKPWLYSSLSGTTPAITVQYRIIPTTTVNTALPTGWTNLSNMTGLTVVAGQMRQFDLGADINSVPAGAIVLVKVTRAGSTDGFTGHLGIPRLDFALL